MTEPSLGPLTPRRRLRAALAAALCGSLILGSLPAFAETPKGSPAAAPAPAITVPTEPTATAAPAPAAEPPPAVEAAPPPAPAPAPPPEPVEVAPPPAPAPTMPMPAEAPASETAPAPAKPKLPSYLMWGVGGASLLVGTIFGIVAVSKENSFKDSPSYDKADTVHTDALASDIGLGLGAILLVSGTVFYFMEDKDDAPMQQAQHQQRKHHPLTQLGVSPVIGMKTQGAAVTLKF